MKRMIWLLLTAVFLLATGCSGGSGKEKQPEELTEEEAVQVTAWSVKSELFMEYAPLRPGKKGSFLIHLSRLADGKPVSEGPLKLVLRSTSGQPVTVVVPAPARPGIYQAEISALAAGSYTLELLPEGKGFVDRIEIPGIQVGGAATAARADESKGDHSIVTGEGNGNIVFLKEQQWSLDTLVRQPESRPMSGRIVASGEMVAAANAEATVSSPVSGVLSAARPLAHVGKRVAKGEVIALIDPPVLSGGGAGQFSVVHAEARNRATLAQQEHERAQRLYEAKIASRKRVEDAEAALDSARAALTPLDNAVIAFGGDDSGRLVVRAPLSGSVVEVMSGPGKGIEAGQPIVRIVNPATLWLRTSLPAVDAGRLPPQPSAIFTVAGQEGSFKADRLVSVGDMLDPQSRTLPVIFSVPNPDARLKVGMFATVALSAGVEVEALTLPVEALMEDEGRFFVFVQTSGERFVRQEVRVGMKEEGMVQIVKGLSGHERVVVKGAYYVKQAALAAKKEDPHAGHAH